MPVRPGERIDPEGTRDRILEVSEDLFYRRGICAVGITEIADAAEASKMSIYKNFGSKEGLVEATLNYRSERVHRWLAEGTAQVPPGPDRVLAVFDMLAAWFREPGFRGCAMVSAAAEDRVSGAIPTRLARAHLQSYRELLTQFLNEAGAVDPGGIARRLLVLIEGATLISAIDGDPSVGADARALAEAVLASASGLSGPSPHAGPHHPATPRLG
ncbi:MAG TPA: TetR/AcrR family transcriptional regulator [Pseudonocardiaceae bacterium]